MNGLWKKRAAAFFLTLVMLASLMPAALATEGEGGENTGTTVPSEPCPGGAHTGEWENTTSATCTSGGTQTRTCTVCGTVETRSTNPTGHTYGDWSITTPATCEAGGVRTKVCTVCGGGEITENTSALGHSYDDGEITSPPTCTTAGIRTKTCSRCGNTTTEPIPAAHTWNSGVVTTAATCKDAGVRTYTCTVCNATKTESIPKLTTHGPIDPATGKCTICQAQVNHVHSYATAWSMNATQHWHACTGSGCSSQGSLGAHTDVKNNVNNLNGADGKCDVCGYQMSTVASYTVTYQMLNSSGNLSRPSYSVASGGYPTVPATPSVTIGGVTYTFNRWTLSTANDPWYLYNGQVQENPANTRVTGNITYYAIYTSNGASTTGTDITITAEPGKSTNFDERQFLDAFRTKYPYDTPSYVTFSVSSNSYRNFYGKIYSGSTELSANDLNDSFNYSGGSSSRRLTSLSFQADRSARNGDTLTMTYEAYNGGKSVTGRLTLKVGDSSSAKGDINYKVDPGKSVTMRATDFRAVLRDSYSNANVSYVVFSQPSSSAFDNGTLYYDRSGTGETVLNRNNLSSYDFYYSPSSYQRDLDKLTFVATNNFRNEISLKFTVYGTGRNESVTGTVVITSTSKSGTKGDIHYEVAPGKSVKLLPNDFRKLLRDEYSSSSTVDYVQFRRPSSTSIFSNGTLYYDYGGGSNEIGLTRTSISSYKFYYSPGKNDYDLDDLTFVAGSNFKDEITLEFTVYGTNSNQYVDGTLVLESTTTSKTEKGDINYKVTPGKSVDLRAADFRQFLRDEYSNSSTVDYVTFRRPASSAFNNGTLYYDRSSSGEVTLTRNNITGYKFYYSPGRNDYDLDELTFAADSNFKDSITLEFTVYGTGSNEYADGTVVIYTDTTAAAASSYVGSIRYNTTSGSNVQINANDIARYLKQSLPGYNLQYVTLNGVPTTGSLYYNYYNASRYGTATRTQITSSNYVGQSFYFAPTSTTQYALSELTYVPSSYNYCASIPFTAYATGALSVSGTILISVSRNTLSEVYGITPRNTAVNFPASSIYNAVFNATNSALYSIQLLKLPASTAGTIYVGTGATKAATNVQYTYASGANSISQLRFVPTASFTGSVEIPYVALNSNGTALASGIFSLGVVNTVRTFTDVGNSTWCYKYVAELSDAKVISGYSNGSFKPDSTVSYGAALKLIMLAAGYPEQAPTGKNVFSGYLSRAQADGLVTRSNVNLSAPITRLQVAQLAAGALKLSTSNLSSVKPFTDTSDLYVQALNAAGIVEGYFSNGTSTFRPNNSLTRGQMSAIVWRMQNYRK